MTANSRGGERGRLLVPTRRGVRAPPCQVAPNSRGGERGGTLSAVLRVSSSSVPWNINYHITGGACPFFAIFGMKLSSLPLQIRKYITECVFTSCDMGINTTFSGSSYPEEYHMGVYSVCNPGSHMNLAALRY